MPLPPAKVEIRDDKAKLRYEAFVDGDLAAYATYALQPGRINFLHTRTESAFEGRGVGSQLVRTALDDARARGLRVTPTCPFFATYIEDHPAYADLVDSRK
jgi:predicted GNAT family acetyltransferase